MSDDLILSGGPIFDGVHLRDDATAIFRAGRLCDILADRDAPAPDIDLNQDILSPGYTDLQVNGGGGVMLGDDPSVETVERIAKAHHSLGTRAILPTLITDTPESTRASIAAVTEACYAGTPGVAGLHLEGPHLSIARKGAHDADLIRPMTATDLDDLLAAAQKLPALMVTLAPENVTLEQVTTLTQAGVIVSLGHTDADFDTCMAYTKAGATVATHLFNAMSQLGSRTPGLVGAALTSAQLSAGLIADGIHVHPASIRAAFAAKAAGAIFLVSDAMAVAGTDDTAFHLGGRLIQRQDARLTLEDGTLAGADLDLTTALRVLTQECSVPLNTALAAATTHPARLINRPQQPKNLQDFIRIKRDLSGTQTLPAP